MAKCARSLVGGRACFESPSGALLVLCRGTGGHWPPNCKLGSSDLNTHSVLLGPVFPQEGAAPYSWVVLIDLESH